MDEGGEEGSERASSPPTSQAPRLSWLQYKHLLHQKKELHVQVCCSFVFVFQSDTNMCHLDVPVKPSLLHLLAAYCGECESINLGVPLFFF